MGSDTSLAPASIMSARIVMSGAKVHKITMDPTSLPSWGWEVATYKEKEYAPKYFHGFKAHSVKNWIRCDECYEAL